MRKYISYDSIVSEEAIGFIQENSSALIEAISKSLDLDQMDGFDSIWHENVVDRSYSTDDAAFIIANSDNVETDSGLVEGADHDEAQTTIAAYTFSNDVRGEVDRIFDEVTAAVDDKEYEYEIEDDPEPLKVNGRTSMTFVKGDDLIISSVFDSEEEFEKVTVKVDGTVTDIFRDDLNSAEFGDSAMGRVAKAVVQVIFEEDGEPSNSSLQEAFRAAVATAEISSLINQHAPEPIEPNSEEERKALLSWLWASDRSNRGSYPLGSSYIDARCGYMYGTSEHAYVTFDNELGLLLPHLRGKYANDVKAYWDRNYGVPTPSNPTEMLEKIKQMVKDGAENKELREVLPEIEAVLEGSAPRP